MAKVYSYLGPKDNVHTIRTNHLRSKQARRSIASTKTNESKYYRQTNSEIDKSVQTQIIV